MMNLMHEGGWSMWVVLLFGGITMVTAILFAWRPVEEKLGFVRGMTTATIFAILSGLASNLAATFSHVVTRDEWHSYPDIVLAPMAGISESLATPVLGFTLLAIIWLITAIGIRRLAIAA